MRVDWIDSGGGHILVALFVFVIGVILVCFRVTEGKEVMVGSLASLWTVLRLNKREKEERNE